MTYRIRGVCLPDEVEREFVIDGGVLREEHLGTAEALVDRGWMLPGLVDLHTHPGVREPGDPFDAAVFSEQLADHRSAGVLTIRAPGLATRLPAALREPSPRIITAGHWLAAPGGFFEGWGRQVAVEDLGSAAEEELAFADR